jgi:hypothetical protein
MKTKFKDFLLYSLACIGALSLLISANNSTNDQLEYLSSSGKYQVIMADNSRGMAALNNRTGKVKFFKIEEDYNNGDEKYFWNEQSSFSLPSGKYQLLTLEGSHFLSILNVDTGAVILKLYNAEDNKWMDPHKFWNRVPFRLTH